MFKLKLAVNNMTELEKVPYIPYKIIYNNGFAMHGCSSMAYLILFVPEK